MALANQFEKSPNLVAPINVARRVHALGPTILIVDDDLNSEPMWSYIIDKVNPRATIIWATSGVEAGFLIEEALLRGRSFDVVIADIFLSGAATGVDLFKKYQDVLNGRLILMSGSEAAKVVRLLGDCQRVPRYLQKPLDPDDCIQALREVLELEDDSALAADGS